MSRSLPISFSEHRGRVSWVREESAHDGAVDTKVETRPPCPARARYSGRGQLPRKTNPWTHRPWRGRKDPARGPIYGRDNRLSFDPSGSGRVRSPVSRGVPPATLSVRFEDSQSTYTPSVQQKMWNMLRPQGGLASMPSVKGLAVTDVHAGLVKLMRVEVLKTEQRP
jgi:hypothetical protein